MAKLPTLKPRLQAARQIDRVQSLQTGTKRNNGRSWRKLREKVLLRDQYTCQHCGLVSINLEVDHTIPLADGGIDSMENCKSLCSDCHLEKSIKENKTRPQWGGG